MSCPCVAGHLRCVAVALVALSALAFHSPQALNARASLVSVREQAAVSTTTLWMSSRIDGPTEAGKSVLSADETEGLDDLEGPMIVDDDDWEELEANEDLLTGLDLDEEDVGAIEEWPEPRKLTIAAERRVLAEKFSRHEADCGSSEIQIALFSARIKHITEHVVENPKDHASRRGLLALVSKRRRLLNYYHKKFPDKAQTLTKDLGIRFRFKSSIPSRTEKYREFTILANRKKK